MIALLMDEQWIIDNDTFQLEDLVRHIEQKLEQTQYYFSHLIIDDITVYEDFEQYFEDHIREIQSVVIVVRTFQEIRDETLLSATSYLQGALPQIEHLSRRFYQGADEESWQQFSQMVEGIQWLLELVERLSESPTTNIVSYVAHTEQLKGHIYALAEALEGKDLTLIADVMQFDLLETLGSIHEVIQQHIDNEVTRYDLN